MPTTCVFWPILASTSSDDSQFFFLEAIDLVPKTKFKFTNGVGLYESLLNDFSSLPKFSNVVMDEYAVVNVAPSVVPNPYLPSFRIFTYNISGNAQHELQGALKKKKGSKRKHGHDRGDKGNKTTHCQIEEHQKTWICHLNDPWHSDPDSPPRSNQRWTPLGFAQVHFSFPINCKRLPLINCAAVLSSKHQRRQQKSPTAF